MQGLYSDLYKNLPKLPGYLHDLNVLPNQRKSHVFDYSEDVSICKSNTPGIGGVYSKLQLESTLETSVRIMHKGKEENVPAWVAFDRQVLRFYAFFQESVQEKREEQFRIRKVNIYLYLEDDSVYVSEPKTANSGISQGTLIRRHKIVNPNAEKKGQFFMMQDMNVGMEITFYGKTFKIVGCDAFTRELLSVNEITVPENEEFPIDPYTVVRNELTSRMKAKRAYSTHHSLRQFLENDRKVLRFTCVWDDTNNQFGDVHKMEIHYYLADDTIEIKQQVPQGSNRAHSQVFLGRCKLPKRPVGLQSSQTQPACTDFYTDKDFIIGTVVHLYGRPFIICDCDDFTKYYYQQNYGLDHFYPIQLEDIDPTNTVKEIVKCEPSVEKSLVGVIGQGVIPPKTHLAKEYDGVQLCFAAKKTSGDDYEQERRFIISVFVYDGTISVFEKLKAVGTFGGKFLERGRVRKYPSTEYFSARDFVVGSEVMFYGHAFEILEADEKTRVFCELHPELFE